jgi:sugar phosphate isomerase/epimerase
MYKIPFRLAVVDDEISQDFERACHVAAVDLGLEWIELRGTWNKNIANLDESEIAECRRILEKCRLRVIGIASPLFKTDWPGAPLSAWSPQHDSFGAQFTFNQQDGLLEHCIDLARAFNTQRIRCFDFWRLENPAPHREAMNEKLRQAADTCARHNVILMLENELACNTATGSEAATVLAGVRHSNFMLTWDPANAAAAGDTPYPDGYDLLPKERIGHCHCKSLVREPDGGFQWAKVGTGVVDWVGQIRALRRQQYHHGLSLETHWRGAGDAESSTRQSFAGMIDVLRQGGALS